MSLRIIGGTYKRRLLETLAGTDVTRPTSDRARESLFNIFGDLSQTLFVDLFAGSGAMGIEALSRGAKFAYFVENQKDAVQNIRTNLGNLKISTTEFSVVPADASFFLQNFKTNFFEILPAEVRSQFSDLNVLIFADPPYKSAWYTNCVEDVAQSFFSTACTQLVVEMNVATPKLLAADNWECTDERKYGKAKIEFWNKVAI